MLNGKFIVIDGPDGAGKSTQIKQLASFIEKSDVTVTLVRDPGGTDIGEQIRDVLLSNKNEAMGVNCEVLLFMASRAQLYAQTIKPALEADHCVICDRWVSSTIAYQAVAGKMGEKKVNRIADECLERPWPDLTLILDVASDVGLSRVGGNKDRMENKGAAFHQNVRDAFIAQLLGRNDFKRIDGKGNIEEVHQHIVEVILDYVDA